MEFELLKAFLLLLATARLHVSYKSPTPRATVANGALIPSSWKRFMRIITAIIPAFRGIFWALALAEAVTIIAKRYSSAIAQKLLSALLLEGRDGSNMGLSQATVIGCTLALIATHIRTRCYRELGKHFTFELSIHKDHTLVMTGPYSMVRHPSYTAVVLANLSLIVLHGTRGSWVRESGMLTTVWGKVLVGFESAFLVYITIALLTRMKEENKVLKERFGSAWDEWAARVQYKLLPGII